MLDLTDDGYEHVSMKGADGAVVFETDIDLWAVHNRLVELLKDHKDKPAYQFHAGVVTYLQELGFPEVSHRFASRFAGSVFARVQELKNAPAGAPTPGSPASTASIPSP